MYIIISEWLTPEVKVFKAVDENKCDIYQPGIIVELEGFADYDTARSKAEAMAIEHEQNVIKAERNRRLQIANNTLAEKIDELEFDGASKEDIDSYIQGFWEGFKSIQHKEYN